MTLVNSINSQVRSLIYLLPALFATTNIGNSQTLPLLIENGVTGTEAARIVGENTWLSFYRGDSYDGFLWNSSGDIGLGTSHLNSTGQLLFYTFGQERMRMTPGGRIGIGTQDPGYNLHIESLGDYAFCARSLLNAVTGYSNIGIGVKGYSNGSVSSGVWGESAYIGVTGVTTVNSTDIYRQGIRGDNHNSATGYAGYFFGNVGVSGTLSKAAGSFKIDHPLDPENKTLSHSFVESPDMKNIYDGITVTDQNGEATIELPDWFMALNKDFRYQLTVIDQFAQAIILKKIENNNFQIKTNQPNVEVSWQITGIRHDPYAEQHRIPVEENKTAEESGRYLNPRVYDKPVEMAIGYRPAPAVPVAKEK